MSAAKSAQGLLWTRGAQLLFGLLSLFLGVEIYLSARPAPTPTFVPILAPYLALPGFPIPAGSVLNGSLPSFFHTFSFILFTSTICEISKKTFVMICIFWLLSESILELGQSVGKLPEGVTAFFTRWHIPFSAGIRSHFEHGAFDLFDLLAIVGGTIAAYLLLTAINHGRLK